ncbi:MAG: histidine phosphatase family protein [Phycisphaeraceae bacterium]
MRGTSIFKVILIATGPTEWETPAPAPGSNIPGSNILASNILASGSPASGRIQGNTDLPLSADGLTCVEQQAIAHPLLQGAIPGAGEGVSGFGFERQSRYRSRRVSREEGALLPGAGVELHWIYCSPDEASRQTGAIFARAFDGRIKPIEELAEMNLGLWQGLMCDSVAERYAKSYECWNQSPDAVSIPDGETLEQAAERMKHAVGRLLRKADTDRPLVLVLRSIMRGLCRRWLTGLPLTDWRTPGDRDMVTELNVNCAELAEPGRRRRSIVA